MGNKIIKYNLNSDGTIPTYVADGGYFALQNSNPSPSDLDLVGLTAEGATESGLGEFETEQDLADYLQVVGEGSVDEDGNGFDFEGAAIWLWAKRT